MAALYLLDTNIISELMRRPGGPAAQRYRARVGGLAEARIVTSVVVHCELLYGLRKTPSPRLQQSLELQMELTPVLPLEPEAVGHYASLRVLLERAGTPIGPNDSLIAAHALALGATLVSTDTEFARVPGLALENWLT